MEKENNPDLRERLSIIFEKACSVMEAKLEDPENVTAADLNSILGFLKHNGVTAIPAAGTPLARLADKAANTIAFPFSPDRDPSLMSPDEPEFVDLNDRSTSAG